MSSTSTDLNKLYWIDVRMDMIHVVNLHGNPLWMIRDGGEVGGGVGEEGGIYVLPTTQ